MRVLDEVADALRRAGGMPLFASVADLPSEPRQWNTIQKALPCLLPLLQPREGGGFRPFGFNTVWDVVDYVARYHPDWEPPAERTEAAWREAQIFVRVRVTLVDALSVDPEIVTREARLVRDLGA